MQAKIEKIVYPGLSLTRLDNKVVFTDQGLPEELVDLTITQEAKNYSSAKTNQIIQASKYRIIPRCKHYKICSPYQEIDYQYQLQLKRQQILEILKTDIAISVRASKNIWGYRNKIELNILWDKGQAYCAYNKLQSSDSFEIIDTCFLLPESINQTIQQILAIISANKLHCIEKISLRQSRAETILIMLKINQVKDIVKTSTPFYPLSQQSNITGIICSYKEKNQTKSLLLWGKNYLQEKINLCQWQLSSDCFFQINIDLLEIMLAEIQSFIPQDKKITLADLYCGIGTFGIYFASNSRQVIFVESEEENLNFLNKNIKNNKLDNALIYPGLSQNCIDKVLANKLDMLIIDPPRKGIDPYTCQQLIKHPVANLIYISCNPTTLARDLNLLKSAYKIKTLALYDFFPHTPHIETMLTLEKN